MKEIINFNIIIVMAFSLSLTACQTSLLKNFNQVNSSMDKDDVLDIMGTPERTERFHGKDRWTYVFYDQRVRYEKEVHFQNSKVVYFGDIWEPPVDKSAAVIDQKNQEIEKQYQAAQEKMIAAKKEAPLQYEKYQSEVSGNDSIRYMPEFTPVK